MKGKMKDGCRFGRCRNKEKREDSELIRILNKYSMVFHVFLACGICFIIEWISRHSFIEACEFVGSRWLVFLYNSLIIYASLMLVYIFKRRAVSRVIISVFWLLLGVINGCVLAKRVTPFCFTDLKMISDLFTMQSNYFSTTEAVAAIILVSLVLLCIIAFWFKGPKFSGTTHRLLGTLMAAAVIMAVPLVTDAAVNNHILATYFENIAQGYREYGFVYSFSSSVLDRGMSTPENYSEEAVQEVLAQIQSGESVAAASGTIEKNSSVKTMAGDIQSETGQVSEDGNGGASVPPDSGDADEYPNIICVLLESFVDPQEINFLELSEDPVPNFRYLYENYSSGYLEVPVVGAGTANTEFEILTGMGMQFFGLGEYPYKTILKKTNCESIASDLTALGYGAHAVHNNGGNFYSRANAFSMMGFTTFTCKEMMNIVEYTPLGTWPTDNILIGEVEKSLDYTPDQPDFVYTITVQGHGDYPEYQVIENPEIQVSGAEDEGRNYAWEYYVNEIHEVDKFIKDLIEMLSRRDEKTIVVMFGDHLPTMGLTEEDMATGSLFKTKYITWNNFGLEKQDADVTSYQLMAEILDQLDIHTGTMFQYHQERGTYASEEAYINGMELLQYDILYGEHYVYGGENPYPATDLVMGTQDVVISDILEDDEYYYIYGESFTKWSKVYVDDKKVSTKYLSGSQLRIAKDKLKEGINVLTVKQVGSSDTIFRTSNEYVYEVLPETESVPEVEYETEAASELVHENETESDMESESGAESMYETETESETVSGS